MLENLLRVKFPEVNYVRPLLKHADPLIMAKDSLKATARKMELIEPNSLIIGVSMGGLIACGLQERFPDHNLSVFTVSSPTDMPSLSLQKRIEDRRVALYSHLDEVIGDRVARWPELTNLSFDCSWMKSHNTEDQKFSVASVISAYMAGEDVRAAVENVFPA